MGDYVRRLVSGNKARHKDGELQLELDLAYITDQVIVMGYPATGIEGLYRNRREDAKEFLEHRHGKNFWVFNFCPIKENSYPADVFDGRVSRYPFPDHHAPPLAILPLIAREIRLWLDGSPNRVAVLHCKAGKGRSGTMACAYLLAVDMTSGGSLQPTQSLTAKERAKSAAEAVMDAMPVDETAAELIGATTQEEEDLVKLELADATDDAPGTGKDTASNLTAVLDLHTSKRMKRASSPSEKLKQGVSIPSQRRWLYYWSLVLAHQAPPGFWTPEASARPPPKVRVTALTLRMRELSGLRGTVVRAANALLERTGRGARGVSANEAWASLARYDDALVDALERGERDTRREGGSSRARTAVGAETFRDGQWDTTKMVRSFARMGPVQEGDAQKEKGEDGGKIETLVLRPLTGDKWELIRTTIEAGGERKSVDVAPEGEDASVDDVTQTLKGDGGVVLDAHREVRVKLYLGQVFMGWFWFIPTFHMPHPRDANTQQTTLTLTRKELDFPLGIGANIIDVAVSMEWCPEAADVLSPPERATSADSAEGRVVEPGGLAAALPAIAAGEGGDLLEAQQAADD
ncbi:phosphatases II [Epithele typhae]|uniref:phosphatases II n=1 Tax=Epithele typhae TaxID=378194 RepID=UPI002007E069|nr:phosphatases II [Epithele typhae]KAH9916723.1 phosphatases II [Epithele typhae]